MTNFFFLKCYINYGDDMKKNIIWGILFIIFGFLMGEVIFSNKDVILDSINSKSERYYLLQEGVYSSREILNNNLEKIPHKVVDYQNDKYYVYVGITKDKKVAEKLKKIYKLQGIQVIIKEKALDNEEFSNDVTQFDLLINATNEKEEILTIEEVVLASYDETIKNSSKN